MTAKPTRRQVLTMMGASGVAAAGGYGILTSGHNSLTGSDFRAGPVSSSGPAVLGAGAASADVASRLLVVIELRGGNDGLATVVPESGLLRDLRPNLRNTESGLVDFVTGTSLHAGLVPLRDRGLAVVQGLGVPEPNGSHFEMEKRWWEGDSTGRAGVRTGFLGRLCDELDADAPITGVSIGAGATPFLTADKATTIGMPDPWAGWFLTEEDPWFDSLRAGLAAMGRTDAGESDRVVAARQGVDDALVFAEVLGAIDEDEDRGFPATDLGFQLQLAGGMLDSDIGIRVLHIPFGGFDTHDEQGYQHDQLMNDLGASVAALQDDLIARELADKTLIVTTSEFGRRPEENAGGTDHGTAGPALICGPVTPGLHADAPRIDRLDDDGNLIATTMMDDYYATIAQGWLGIDAALVLPSKSTLISDLFSA